MNQQVKPSTKRTLWIVPQVTQDHERRCLLLNRLGHHVMFATIIDKTLSDAEKSRPSTIIFDSMADYASFAKWLNSIVERRSLSATRLILNITRQDPEVSQAAWTAGFRDLISHDLPDNVWSSRIQFSASSKPLQLRDVDGAISLTSPATVTVPGRIVWINESHVRLEFKGQHSIGSTMMLRGPLTQSLGTDHLSLVVESIDRQNLLYRYSQAFECRWSVPEEDFNRVAEQIRSMRAENRGPKRRAFVACQDPVMRQALTDVLSSEEFDVNVALQRPQINAELKFFSPDVFILDDTLASSFDDNQTEEMVDALPNHSIAIVISTDESMKPLSPWLLQRAASPILSSNRDPQDVLDEVRQVVNSYVPDYTPGNDDPVHFQFNHLLSPAELNLSARLKLMSPRFGVLALNSPMSSFALLKLDIPLIHKSINREIYIKTIQSYESRHLSHRDDFSYLCDFMLNDVTKTEAMKIGQRLIESLAYHYQEFNTSFGLRNTSQRSFQSTSKSNSTSSQSQTLAAQSVDSIPDASGGPAQSEKVYESEADHLDLTTPEIELSSETRPVRTTSEPSLKLSVPSFMSEWRAYVDPVIAKALLLFLVAAAIMGVVIHTASNVEQPASKELGKVYSDFFIRMRDAEPLPKPTVPEDK